MSNGRWGRSGYHHFHMIYCLCFLFPFFRWRNATKFFSITSVGYYPDWTQRRKSNYSCSFLQSTFNQILIFFARLVFNKLRYSSNGSFRSNSSHSKHGSFKSNLWHQPLMCYAHNASSEDPVTCICLPLWIKSRDL